MKYLQISKIIKTGTSLCVVVPKNILKALHWERGDQIVFGILNDDTLVVRKISEEELL